MPKGIILVTGASGFVGTAVCKRLLQLGCSVRTAGRPRTASMNEPFVPISNLADQAHWRPALQGVSHVIHLAARTHVLRDNSPDPLAAYRAVNVSVTQALTRAAASSGVERLLFLSSIKVNGETTTTAPFRESDAPAPEDAYGQSKLEAELALQKIGHETGLESVILRPPLVYGPGVKGNFLELMRAIARGLPLPFSSVHNRRSLIYVDNLADAIIACLDRPQAAGKTYLLSDGEDLSTAALIRQLAHAMSKQPLLLPCPPALLRLGASMIGKRALALRLTGSLQIDNTRIRSELGWAPCVPVEQGLERTAQWYHQTH